MALMSILPDISGHEGVLAYSSSSMLSVSKCLALMRANHGNNVSRIIIVIGVVTIKKQKAADRL